MRKVFFIVALIMLLTGIHFNEVSIADEPVLIFELTEEEVDAFLNDTGGHKFLRQAGRDGQPAFSKDPNGGIRISDRAQWWHALDIRCCSAACADFGVDHLADWMEEGKTYNIRVEFRSSTPMRFAIRNTDAPYNTIHKITEDAVTHATLEHVLAYVEGQRGIRLSAPDGVHTSFTVANILIYEGDLPADAIVQRWEADIPSLYQTFSEHFRIGNIMDPGLVTNSGVTGMFLHQYNSVTAENAMKPQGISPEKGVYNFEAADRLVDWAVENDLEVHGHTLVWHSQSARWLTTDSNGQPLTRAEAKANMEDFITNYAGHFSGRVSSWDVVNEVLDNSVPEHTTAWRDGLRKGSPWYLAYANGLNESAGETPGDYIYDAFVFTRLAAPDATLFYNDFNEESPGKREAMARMAEELNEKWRDDPLNTEPDRLLIEGLGMQSHYWTDILNPADVRATIERFIEAGVRIRVTELDIVFGSFNNQWDGIRTPTETELAHQAGLYAALFRMYADYSEFIDAVTIWGRADHESWRAQGFPLLFNNELQAKDAFWSIIETVNPTENEEPPIEPPVIEAPPPDETPVEIPDEAPPPEEPLETDEPGNFPWLVIIIVIAVIAGPVIPYTIISIRKKKK